MPASAPTGSELLYIFPAHEGRRHAAGPARLRRDPRRVRLAGRRRRQDQPLLPRRGAVPRPLLGLPHAVAWSARRARRRASTTACTTNGPNFNIRKENAEQVLFAIRNGGFSGAIMPENIVVGNEAQEVAQFLAAYSGKQRQNVPVGEHHAARTQIRRLGGTRPAPRRARPQADPRGPRAACARRSAAPRRATSAAAARRGARARPRAGASCCPSSRACAPSRTRPTSASAPPPTRTRASARSRRCGPSAARVKELERASSPRSKRSCRRRSRRCPTCPTRPPRPGPRTSSSRRSASRRSCDFEPRDHLELAGAMIDMERAAQLSGSRFAYLRGDARDGRAGARALGAREAPRPRLRAGDPAGAGARARALRHRLPARHRAADLRARPRTSCSWSAPPRWRWPRCTTTRSSTPSACRCATPASRRASAARPARPGKDTRGIFRVHQFDKVEMFSFVEPERLGRRARADPRDRGGDPRRARTCPTASSTSPSTTSATRPRRSTTARRGSRARAATAS